MTATVSKARRRPNRRDRLTVATGDFQHVWIMIMLKQCGLPVKQDALLDHGRLMHHLVHGTMAAPSGAMMDEDYASMSATVGGHDDGNMVAQMQRVVCSEVNPSSDSLYSLPPTYDSRQGHLDTCDLLQRQSAQASSVQARGEAGMDTPDQKVGKYAPTAPDWDANTAQTDCGPSAAPVHLAQPIQCVSYPPVQGTSPTMTLLALTGCVSIVAMVGLIVALSWVYSYGVRVTGFWLTLSPSTAYPGDEHRALP